MSGNKKVKLKILWGIALLMVLLLPGWSAAEMFDNYAHADLPGMVEENINSDSIPWNDASGKLMGLDIKLAMGGGGGGAGCGGEDIDTDDGTDGSGQDETIAVTDITLSPESAAVNVGETIIFTATLTPADATNQNVTFSSSNTDVATISTDGTVTGVAEGTSTITVIAQDGDYQAESQLAVSTASGSDETTDYTLTIINNGSGQTDPAAGTYVYEQGTSVTVTATAASTASFTGWSGAASGTTNPISITMDADQTLTANFAVSDDDDSSEYELPDECSGACNSATPVYPTIMEDGGLGNVTMYTTEASSGGACNYGETDVMYFAAMSVHSVPGDYTGQWQGGSICGQCAEVTTVTSQGPKKVVVRIMDKCPDGNCGIDLGGSAPAEVMVDGFGRYDGSWRFVSCENYPETYDGEPSLDVITGSNQWWSRVHVRNGNGAVDSIVWQDTSSSVSGTFPFASNPENAYEVPQTEVLQSSMTSILITILYYDGSTATVTLSPEQLGVSGASYPLD